MRKQITNPLGDERLRSQFCLVSTFAGLARVATPLLLGLSLFVETLAAHAAPIVVYRWVDPENRRVHYSDSKPPNAVYEVVPVAGAPPHDPNAERRLQAIESETTRWALTQMREQELQQRENADAVARKRDCERARSQLENLSLRPGPRLRLVESDGAARRMTEEERQDRIAAGAQRVDTLCAGVH